MKDAFCQDSIALHILRKQYPKKDDLQKVIRSKTKIGRLCGSLGRLGGWLSYTYQALTRHEQSQDIWSHMTSKWYNTGTLKSISHLYLGEHILHKLLCVQQQSPTLSYVMERGTLPFFLGAVVVKDQSLCDFFQSFFERMMKIRNIQSSKNYL